MVTLQSVHCHTGLMHPFNFLTFEHSGTRAPECSNVKKLKGALDQYGAEHLDRLTFATIEKAWV